MIVERSTGKPLQPCYAMLGRAVCRDCARRDAVRDAGHEDMPVMHPRDVLSTGSTRRASCSAKVSRAGVEKRP